MVVGCTVLVSAYAEDVAAVNGVVDGGNPVVAADDVIAGSTTVQCNAAVSNQQKRTMYCLSYTTFVIDHAM